MDELLVQMERILAEAERERSDLLFRLGVVNGKIEVARLVRERLVELAFSPVVKEVASNDDAG